jgi:ribosomal protein L12E/L44/L45/RPP1/RPP2
MSDKVVNSIIKKLYINPLRKRAVEAKTAAAKTEAAAAAAAAAAKARRNNYDKKLDAMIKNLFEAELTSNSEVNSFINSIFTTLPVKKTATLKRKRNNNNSNISEPQLKKARIALENVEEQIKNLEDANINSLFSKLSLKNTTAKTAKAARATKAAMTRKLNKLRQQEESLKLILKAQTRYQLKKLLEK